MVHGAICPCCDWSEKLLWFWFFDSHLKTALLTINTQPVLLAVNYKKCPASLCLLQGQRIGSSLASIACEASVSVLFWSKGHAKNGASKRGGGGEERKETFPSFPSPSPLFHFFAFRFISRAAKTEHLVPRSFFAP